MKQYTFCYERTTMKKKHLFCSIIAHVVCLPYVSSVLSKSKKSVSTKKREKKLIDQHNDIIECPFRT